MSTFWLANNMLWQTAGWTMLHFLWIGGVFSVVAALIDRAAFRRSAEVRYSIAVTQFLIFALIPCCLFVWRLNNRAVKADGDLALVNVALEVVDQQIKVDPFDRDVSTSNAIAPQEAGNVAQIDDRFISAPVDSIELPEPLRIQSPRNAKLTAESFHTTSNVQTAANLVRAASTWLMNLLPWVWLVGFPLTCVTLLLGISGAERFRRRCQILNNNHPAVALCHRLQRLLNLRRQILIGVTDSISAPILVGIVRPLILFPASTLAGISTEQLEMILLHELAHVRRWDNLVNLLQRVTEAVLFFHPVVWWLSNRIRLEREHCCDAAVLAHIGAPQTYAEMLVQMAFSKPPADWMMATSISQQLIPRIRRILKQEEDRMQVSRKVIVASLTILLSLAVATAVNAQRNPVNPKEKPAAIPADEKADSKPDDIQDDLYKVQTPLDPAQQATSISIRGTILKEDGEPARWCQVWLTGMTHLPGSRYGAAQIAFVRADADGNFQFWHPIWKGDNPTKSEQEILWVMGRTRDGALTKGRLLNLTGQYRGKKGIHDLILQIASKKDYVGRVVDENGKPISNVKVTPLYLSSNVADSLSLFPELGKRYSATTNADGEFTLLNLPDSMFVMARFSIPSRPDREIRWASQTRPDLHIEPGATIRGKITNLPEKGLREEILLSVQTKTARDVDKTQPLISVSTHIKSQKDGSFEIQDVPPGEYELRISHEHNSFAAPQEFYTPILCQAKSGQVSDEIVMKLPNVIVGSGRVVDRETKKEIAGAQVRLMNQEGRGGGFHGVATTDAKGNYLAYVPPGKYLIEAYAAPPGYLSPNQERQGPFVPHDKDFEGPTIELDPATMLRGTVVDQDGQPVTGADIRWIAPYRAGDRLFPKEQSDGSGTFQIPNIDPGDTLPIRARTSTAVSVPVVIQPADIGKPQQVVISPVNAFRVKGKLTDDRGKPIVNAKVCVDWHRSYVSKKTIMSGSHGELDKHLTDENGQFESAALWPEDGYSVVIEVDGYSKKELQIVKGRRGEVHDYGNIRLKGTGQSVTGRVLSTTGDPIPNATVFSCDATDIVSTTTNNAGSFRLDGLLSGPVYIFAEHSDHFLAGMYVSDSTEAVTLKMSQLASGPKAPSTFNLDAFEAKRNETAEQLAKWVESKQLKLRPNLRDTKFYEMARTNPTETLEQIGKQSKGMDYRSAILISRNLAPFQPAKHGPVDPLWTLPKLATENALKFVERAASRIGDQDQSRRTYCNADVGLMYVRLGDLDRGKVLIEAAAKEWSESPTPEPYIGSLIAQGMARYDVPRALSFQDKIKEAHDKIQVRNRVIIELSMFDLPQALKLFNDPSLASTRSFGDDQLKFELAYRIGAVEPDLAARITTTIQNPRTKAEASGWTAVSVFKSDPNVARMLIDRGFTELRNHRQSGPDSSYYEYVPAVAANLAFQAAQIQHPELESLIQTLLSLRIPADAKTSPISRLKATVNAAIYLAFIDPDVARRLLADLEPELDDKLLGHGGYESVGIQQWLYAWVLADPEHAAKLIQEELEKPLDNKKIPYPIEAAYTLLFLNRAEQLEYIRQYSNTGIAKPFIE